MHMAGNESDEPAMAFIRALSDIYEATEPSLLQHTPIRPKQATLTVAATSSNYSPTPPETPPNLHRIPPAAVPKRTSSRNHRKVPIRVASSVAHGSRTVGVLRRDRAASSATISSAGLNQSRIYFPPTYDYPHPSLELIDDFSHGNSHFKLELRPHGSLYVGGSSVKGTVHVKPNGRAKSRQAQDQSVVGGTIDLLGFEETHPGDRAIFLALRSSLLDSSALSPMIVTGDDLVNAKMLDDHPASSSQSTFLFSLRLPYNTGPPVFSSKHAAIKFILSATVTFREAQQTFHLRCLRPVQILPAYSFEAALQPLNHPLLIHDVHESICNGQQEALAINLRLSRHVWVSGGSLFVDVQVSNQTSKHVRELAVLLEESITLYLVPAVTASDRSETSGRLVKEVHRKVIAKHKICKTICGWHGVSPHSSDMRSCHLDIPRSAATISNTKLCKVEYVLIARARSSRHCVVHVQAPVTLIRLESLTAIAPVSHLVKDSGRPNPSITHHAYNPTQENIFINRLQSRRSRTHPLIDNALHPRTTQPNGETHRFGENERAHYEKGRTSSRSKTSHLLQRSNTGKKLESRSLSHLQTRAVELEKAFVNFSDNPAGAKKMRLYRKRGDQELARFPLKDLSVRIPRSHSSADPLLRPKASWQIERNDDTGTKKQTFFEEATTLNDRLARKPQAEDDRADDPSKYVREQGQGGPEVVMQKRRIFPQSLQDFEKVKIDGNGNFLGTPSEQTWI